MNDFDKNTHGIAIYLKIDHLLFLNIDETLKKLSVDVMTFLGFDYQLLLFIIAKNGPMNGKNLGKVFQNNARHSFDRWGVKRRMEGLGRQFSLIKNDYMCKIPINKKEIRYGLTLKGIIASLANTKFEKIYHVRNFENLLKKYAPEPKLQQWVMDFIKYEIALILFYNYIQGIEWKKFKYLKSYLKELKKPYKIIPQYFLNTTLLEEKDRIEFEFIKTEYLKSYFLIYLSIPEADNRESQNKLDANSKEMGIDAKFEFRHNNLELFMRQWYMYLEFTDMDEAEDNIIEEMINVGDSEHYDPFKWFIDTEKAYENAKIVLKENGMPVKRKIITLGERP